MMSDKKPFFDSKTIGLVLTMITMFVTSLVFIIRLEARVIANQTENVRLKGDLKDAEKERKELKKSYEADAKEINNKLEVIKTGMAIIAFKLGVDMPK